MLAQTIILMAPYPGGVAHVNTNHHSHVSQLGGVINFRIE